MHITRFKCVICGKISSGRLTGRYSDRTERYPRRHKGADGNPCPGNIEYAEWVDVEGSTNAITGKVKMGTG